MLIITGTQKNFFKISISNSFSTCVGRFYPTQSDRTGVLDYKATPELLQNLNDDFTVSPTGAVFVKPHIREGVLRKMLSEILDTRIMVKSSMKQYRDRKVNSISLLFLLYLQFFFGKV